MPANLNGCGLSRRATLLAIRLATAAKWATVPEGYDNGDVLSLVWAYLGDSELSTAIPYCFVLLQQSIHSGAIAAMTATPKGELFIAVVDSDGECNIVAVGQDCASFSIEGLNEGLLFGGVHGMTADEEGRLYVTSGGRILRFDASSRIWSKFAPPSSTRGGHHDGLAEPEQLWFDLTTGILYVGDWGSDRVIRFDSQGSPTVLLKNIGGVRQAVCVSDGRLVVVDGKNVLLWKSNGEFDCVLPGSEALECPVAIAYDRGREMLYVLDASPAAVGSPVWRFRWTKPSREVVSDLCWIDGAHGVLDDAAAGARIKVCDGRHGAD
ncbi:hypothetical protein FOL47_003979 [Perkinsus chesapeaki]|uniref:NHL repeat containing n=1 Tax=Perkinsus chesapeaki TaxID=330153 RepID=A0A7J6MZC5_PERCH|nr:hypothetical protein FOL47_003979 [Perkinsus chesapeaki]